MEGDTVQTIAVIAATMVGFLGMLWGVMTLVTKTVVQQVDKWQQDAQAQLGEFKADIDRRFDAVDKRFDAVDKRFDAVDRRFDAVDRRFAEVHSRLDKQSDQIVDVRNQVAALSERMARVEERVGIPAEPVVTA